MPCSSISAAPIGIVSFTGQYWTAHSVNECSPRLTAISREPVPGPQHRQHEDEEEDRGDDVGNRFAAHRKMRIEHVDPDVLILAIGVGSRQHVHHAEHEKHALVHPVRRRIEHEPRNDLVVVGKDRDQAPVGDENADIDVSHSSASVMRVCIVRVGSSVRCCSVTTGAVSGGGAVARAVASRAFARRTSQGISTPSATTSTSRIKASQREIVRYRSSSRPAASNSAFAASSAASACRERSLASGATSAPGEGRARLTIYARTRQPLWYATRPRAHREYRY